MLSIVARFALPDLAIAAVSSSSSLDAACCLNILALPTVLVGLLVHAMISRQNPTARSR